MGSQKDKFRDVAGKNLEGKRQDHLHKYFLVNLYYS